MNPRWCDIISSMDLYWILQCFCFEVEIHYSYSIDHGWLHSIYSQDSTFGLHQHLCEFSIKSQHYRRTRTIRYICCHCIGLLKAAVNCVKDCNDWLRFVALDYIYIIAVHLCNYVKSACRKLALCHARDCYRATIVLFCPLHIQLAVSHQWNDRRCLLICMQIDVRCVVRMSTCNDVEAIVNCILGFDIATRVPFSIWACNSVCTTQVENIQRCEHRFLSWGHPWLSTLEVEITIVASCWYIISKEWLWCVNMVLHTERRYE